MSNKKYYWLKMHKDFFKTKDIKKLRKISGGDTFTIIYLKMMLLSIDNGGLIAYEGIEPTFAEELALELDEDAVNVNATLLFLQNMKLIEEGEDDGHVLKHVEQMIGSETPQAGYMRKKRVATNQPVIDNNVTLLTPVTKPLQQSKELELEIELDKDINTPKNINAKIIFDFWNLTTETNPAASLSKTRSVTDKLTGAINSMIGEKFDIDDIKRGISNYAGALADPNVFFTHRWTLIEFIQRQGGCRKFADITEEQAKAMQKTQGFKRSYGDNIPI